MNVYNVNFAYLKDCSPVGGNIKLFPDKKRWKILKLALENKLEGFNVIDKYSNELPPMDKTLYRVCVWLKPDDDTNGVSLRIYADIKLKAEEIGEKFGKILQQIRQNKGGV